MIRESMRRDKTPVTNFYIVGVDSGKARNEVFNRVKNVEYDKIEKKLYIDLRVAFDKFEIFFVPFNESAMKEYTENLEHIIDRVPVVQCDQRHYIGTVFDLGSCVLRGIIGYLNKEFPTDEMNWLSGDSRSLKYNWFIKPDVTGAVQNENN